MAVHLNLSNTLGENNEGKEAKIHSMPCLIKSNDEANVSKYFEPNITVLKDDSEYFKILNQVRL